MRWIAVVLACLLAAPAEAATVRATVEPVETSRDTPERNHMTWRVADPRGVPDRLVVRPFGDGIEVSAARPLSAGRACRKHRPRIVRCVTPRRAGTETSASLHANLGEGNDRLVLKGATGEFATVSGGDGRDVIDGRRAPHPVSLSGGAGADRLMGSHYDDQLAGGGGADTLHGGGGTDLATWHGTRPVRVDLIAGTARSAGTTDRLTGIENLEGGSGPDDLRGAAGPNEIRGGRGADRIQGRAGDDRVDGEGLGGEDFAVDVVDGGNGDDWVSGLGGGDVLIGGPGDDLLRSFTAPAWRERSSRARCGAGRDTVSYPVPEDLVEPDCEVVEHRASWSGPRVVVPPAVVDERWRVPVSWICNDETAKTCRVAAVLTVAGTSRILGSAEAELAHGAEQTLDLQLTPEGLEEVRRRGSLLGRLYIGSNNANYTASWAGATLRLKAPG